MPAENALRVGKYRNTSIRICTLYFRLSGKQKAPVSDEYINEWRRLLTRTNYFGLEEWYTEMGVEDNAQAAIYTEESANILRKLNLKSFESDYKILVMWLPEKMNPGMLEQTVKDHRGAVRQDIVSDGFGASGTDHQYDTIAFAAYSHSSPASGANTTTADS